MFWIECGLFVLQTEAMKASLVFVWNHQEDLTWHFRFAVCKGFTGILFGCLWPAFKKFHNWYASGGNSWGPLWASHLQRQFSGWLYLLRLVQAHNNNCTRICFFLAIRVVSLGVFLSHCLAPKGMWLCFCTREIFLMVVHFFFLVSSSDNLKNASKPKKSYSALKICIHNHVIRSHCCIIKLNPCRQHL